MTRRRLSVLLTAVIAAAAAIGGFVYSRHHKGAPIGEATKSEDVPLTAPEAKAVAPARSLNEKERLLVGLWKFEKSTPPMPGQKHEATFEYGADGTFVFRSRSVSVKPYSIRGTYQIVGDVLVDRNDDGGASSVLIEEFTEDRIVTSYPDGVGRHVEEWVRLRELPRWN